MAKKKLIAKTQQHKSVSLRDLWYRMSNGLPLNVPVREVFDAHDDKDSDIDENVFDENADKLELLQYRRDKAEQDYLNQKQKYEDSIKALNEKAKKAAEALAAQEQMINQQLKGGINDETKTDEEKKN